MSLYTEFEERGMLAQCTHPDEVREALGKQSVTMYSGFDPTADSMHVGHLIPVMGLARAQRAGHKVIALVGGGTAVVGDPSGKSSMRQMLTNEEIENNKVKIGEQLKKFITLDDEKGLLVNNLDWLGGLNYLSMLREIGVHFSVNRMLTFECFKQRLESGLSFLEFNYMILQAYDFLELNDKHDCTLQLGGDDQWSNMLAGVELIRRCKSKPAYALTYPLLTTSEGKKMGKTEKGAVWLDPARTTPYEYYQYWRNVPDDRVKTCLSFFTFLPMDEVNRLGALKDQEINQAKEVLAFEATKIVHGETEAQQAQQGAKAAFSGTQDTQNIPATEIPQSEIGEGLNVVELLKRAKLAQSNREARRLVEGGGVYVNGERATDVEAIVPSEDFKDGVEIRKGKKHHHRIVST